MNGRTVIVILGPTASGKSALGIRLATRFRGVIVSADSRQIYRGYTLGSGKVTKRERRGIRHFLLDIASPKRQYTAADFSRDFQATLKRVPERTPIFLVGGSPFYIDAALQPNRLASVKPNPTLRRRLALRSLPQLLAQLKRRDPRRHATIDRLNRRRVERALEIAIQPHAGIPLAGLQLQTLKIGIAIPRAKLYKKIDARVEARLRQGMLREIDRLHARGVSWKRLDALGLEARFLSRALRETLTLTEATQQLKGAIHAFARRQLTWWRRDQSIHWVTSARQAKVLTRHFLRPPATT